MDDFLEALILSEEADDAGPREWVEFSPDRWVQSVMKWKLHDPSHLQLYRLWRGMRGAFGGGESLKDLWELSQMPGSSDLLEDFNTIRQREAFLRWRLKRMPR